MTAQRKYQHDTFQDTSWGTHGLLNVDIPTLELTPLPTTTQAHANDELFLHCVPTPHPLQPSTFYVPKIGLALIGGAVLLGGLLTGNQLWQHNAHQQQHVFTATQPFIVNAAPMALAAIVGTPATPNPIVLPDTAKILQEAQATARTLYGRDDPFSPLVSPELPDSANAANGNGGSAEAAPPGPILSFVGLIEGASGSGRLVAILKSTGETPTTYIKEPGDRFEVDGHRVILKRVNKRDVAVVIDGLVETLSLQEYSDNAASANSTSSRSDSSTAMPTAGQSR